MSAETAVTPSASMGGMELGKESRIMKKIKFQADEKNNCKDCKCQNCMFTMPQGDHTDCYHCEMCDGKEPVRECEGCKSWNEYNA